MELTQNIWTGYGFRNNPFDTGALSAFSGAMLPIAKAIVGRALDSQESRMLLGVLRSAGGGRAVVEGAVGIGKTTFVNYYRYLWETEAQDKLLTPVTEITLAPNQRITDFIANILGAVLTKILLLRGEKYVHDRPLLQELFVLNRVYVQRSMEFQATVFGVGGGIGHTAQTTISEPSEVQLRAYLRDLLTEVKLLGFKGIFLHFDNLELISLKYQDNTRELFENLRDLLQTPDIYFIFVGQRGFFSEIISPQERVRSIFSGFPIVVPPLSKEQVLEAVEKRYHLLASQPGRFIRPVDNTLLDYLYDLYKGKVRFILDAVTSIITNLPYMFAETLDSETAKRYLAGLVLERLKQEVKGREWDVLREAVRLGDFTNADLTRALKQQRQNIGKYLDTLLAKRLIYLDHREGRQLIYRVSEEVRIIRDFPDQAQNI